MDEKERITTVYAKRRLTERELYSYFKPAHLFYLWQREKKILELLYRHGLNPLSDKKILDVGCGNGGLLRDFIQYGALPENLYGLDLLEDKIEQAKRLSPNIDFRCGDAEELPYEDESFDIVMQFTVFTSSHF